MYTCFLYINAKVPMFVLNTCKRVQALTAIYICISMSCEQVNSVVTLPINHDVIILLARVYDLRIFY